MSQTTDDPVMQKVRARLRQVRSAAIFTHQRPDPDAMGSQAAMAIILRGLGAAQVTVVNFEEPPRLYAFLQEQMEGAQTAVFSPEWAWAAGEKYDTFVIVDTCSYSQLEPVAEFLKAQREKIVVVDHHLSRDDLSPLVLSDTKAAAAAEIVWEISRGFDSIKMDRNLAVPLMAGLVADTGWFRFDAVTQRTHLAAADLTPHMNVGELYERMQQGETAAKLALIQRALANLTWFSQGQGVMMTLTLKDFADTGATQNQTEELVNLPLMVQTTEVAALACEMADGRVRVSLRSKHGVDVNKIGREFNGGGHAKAAGCRLDGPLPVAAQRIEAAMTRALEEQKSKT